MKITRSIITMIVIVGAMFAQAGDSAPFVLDTREERAVESSIVLPYDAAWIGGNSGATVVIEDNGVEIGRVNGAGEEAFALVGKDGLHNLTYKTLIDDVVQEETYTATVFKGWAYEVDDDGDAILVDTAYKAGDVVIPSEIDGYTVVGIGDFAFERCEALTSVTIPDSVVSIGDCAFSDCGSLTNFLVGANNLNYCCENGLLLSKDGHTVIAGINGDVTIPDSVTSIGDGAFSGCRGLTGIKIPCSVKSIGNNAFKDCDSVCEATVPGSQCGIPFGNVTNLVISAGTTSIGYRAFYGCNALTSVSIPNSVNNMDASAFLYCNNITKLAIPQMLCNWRFQEWYFSSCWDKITDIEIQEGATGIGEWAFEGCAFKSVVLPSTLRVIEEGAFGSCSSLTNIVIPANVNTIEEYAFEYCTHLASFVVDEANESYKSVNGILFTKDGKTLMWYPAAKETTAYELPTEVSDVWSGAFECCRSLQSINVADGNTKYFSKDGVLFTADGTCLVAYPAGKVGGYSIPAGVTELLEAAFAGSRGLTAIEFPQGLECIPDLAFDDCTSLTSIAVPDGVTSIGVSSFGWCSSIEEVKLPSSITYMNLGDDPAFVGCGAIKRVAVPQYVLNRNLSRVFPDSYRNIEEVVVVGAVSDVYSSAFSGCESLKRVVFGESVTSIADWNAEVSLAVFEDHAPNGLAESGLISRAGKVSYRQEYDEEFRDIVGDDKFFGYQLTFEGIEFTTSRDGIWLTNENGSSLKSGDTGDDQVSWLQTTVSGKGHYSFKWKVSSEHYGDEIYDFACFLVDGVTNAVFGGIKDWTVVELDLEGSGAHLLRWEYIKDDEDDPELLEQVDDCVWVKDFVWSPKVDVSFSLNGAEGETPAIVTSYVGGNIALPSANGFVKEDHVFAGWSDGVEMYEAGAEYVVPAENVTITAQWTRKTFVSFDLGGGSGEVPQTIKELTGHVVNLPSADKFARDDYVFACWSDGDTAYEAGAEYIVPTEDITVTAQWTKKTFVSFDLGGGSGDIHQTIKELAETEVTLPEADGFAREDYVFAGWSDGKATYAAGAEYTVPGEDITIVAQWTRKTFVSFVVDVEDVVGVLPSVEKALAGEKMVLPSGDDFSRAKYTFTGWSDGENVYEAGAEYEFPAVDTTLTAVWTANTLSAPTICSDDVADGGTIETEFATLKIEAEDGTAIYYTLDESEPTVEGGILYENPFTASAMNVTVKAIAVKNNYFDSNVATFSFTRLPYSAAECLGVDDVDVTLGGDENWSRVLAEAAHDGVAALRSGAIGDSQSTWVSISLEGKGRVSFWWKVSSERTVKGIRRDGCKFEIDGVERDYMDNTTNDWTFAEFDIENEGSHVLKWTYQKNANITNGEDCAWLDEVVWTPKSVAPVVNIDKDKMEEPEIDEESGTRTIAVKGDPLEDEAEIAELIEQVTVSVMVGAEQVDATAGYNKTYDPTSNTIMITLKEPEVGAEEVAKVEDDATGVLADMSDEKVELATAEPEPTIEETAAGNTEAGALPVKAVKGLYYQASWGSDLSNLRQGEKVQATGETIYLGVIKQQGIQGFYKVTVSEQ